MRTDGWTSAGSEILNCTDVGSCPVCPLWIAFLAVTY